MDDFAEVVVGKSEMLADKGAGDDSAASLPSEPGFLDGEPLSRLCWRVQLALRMDTIMWLLYVLAGILRHEGTLLYSRADR